MKPHTLSRFALAVFCPLSLVLALTLAFGPAFAAETPTAHKAPVAQKPPVAKAQPKAKPKVAPRQSTAHITNFQPSAPRTPTPAETLKAGQAAATPVASDPAHAVQAANDPLKRGLDDFAKDCIVKMNRQRKPGINHKEVKTQPDGTFIARYMAVDPDSLVTKYNPTKKENKEIKYIGIMDYHEVEYVSTGKNAKQALAGPFNETNRTPVTELVKYKIKTKKWSY